MSRPKHGISTLSGLIDSDSDDAQIIESNGIPTPDSEAENKASGKRGRGRPKVGMPTKITKAKAPARRASGRIGAKPKETVPAKKPSAKSVAATKGKRKALADMTNQQYASDTEEVEEFEPNEDTIMGVELDAPVAAVKNVKKKVAKRATAGKGGKANKATAQPIEIATPVEVVVQSRTVGKKASTKQQVDLKQSPEKVIQESQAPAMDICDAEDEQVVAETTSKLAHNGRRPPSDSRTRHPSAQRRRAGSASDTERGDPGLRRKLGEMTKKFENINTKYQDLREIGLKEGERNFERLRKQGEERIAASEKLIASLKADAASQASLAKESKALKKKVESQSTEMGVLKEKLAQINASLTEARAENKTLSAKLAANRTAASSVESANTKVPGSAVQANGGVRMMGTAEAAQVAQAAQLKEDLYSDLTGLLIRGVKRDPEDDVFDCIQTGRNGTLHFKLAVANEKSAESYDDAQCQYVPQLDPSRDRALMELLPDYLVEEITFPRPQAARFYARVGKALTEKVE